MSAGPSNWQRAKTRSEEKLVSYLIVNSGRHHTREKLSESLWRDLPPKRARNTLKTALWRLRASIRNLGADDEKVLDVTSAGDIGIRRSADIESDISSLQNAIRACREAPDSRANADALREILSRSSGDFLEGFYDDWVIFERERLNLQILQSREFLLHAYRKFGDSDAALEQGLAILADDPLRESIHRAVISLYMARGQHIRALRQYETCVRSVHQELGIDVLPETRALRSQIMAAREISSRPAGAMTRRSEIRSTLQRMEEAMAELSSSHAELSRRLQPTK